MRLKETELPGKWSEDTTREGREDGEEFPFRFLHLFRCLIGEFSGSLLAKLIERDARTKVLLRLLQREEFLQGRLVLLVLHDLPPVWLDRCLRERTGAVEVEVRDQMFPVEFVDARSVGLRNVPVPHVLTDDCSILRFGQTIVVAVPWSPLRLLGLPPHEELMHRVVDVLTAVVTVEIPDPERKQREYLCNGRFHAFFLDGFHSHNDLPLRHLIHEVDVVDALLLAEISLMHRVYAEEAGSSRRLRLPPLPDGTIRALRLLDGECFFLVAAMLTQAVHLCGGDTCETDEAVIATLVLCPADLPDRPPTEPAVRIVRGNEELDVRACVPLERLMTLVGNIDRTIVPVRGDMPGDLGMGKTGDLPDVLLEDLLLRSLERQVLEPNEGVADPAGTVFSAEWTERDGQRALVEQPEIADGGKKRIVE
jgi:hypothetical protein